MKIYFSCSTAEFFTHRDSYFDIRNFLISSGHTLTRDWLPHTEEALRKGQTDLNRDIKQIYRECITSIKEADLVIIEDTISVKAPFFHTRNIRSNETVFSPISVA